MTNEAATDVRQWLVSARSRGELLATRARVPGVELVMVGVPAGYSAEEVESWLRDLMGMSLESSSSETGDRPIPALLHHLLTGLIFSHSELWSRGGAAAPTSMAFVRTAHEIAFGWVNGPVPELWIDDQRANVEWVRIRDPEGREARALAIDPGHRVRVHFGVGPAGAPVASVDAVWVPDAAEAAAVARGQAAGAGPATSRATGARATATSEPPAASAMTPGAPAAPTDGEGWTVVYEGHDAVAPAAGAGTERRSWWSGVGDWLSGRGAKPGGNAWEWSEKRGAIPDRIPPTPEPAELTARTAPTVAAGTHAELGGISLSPLAPEDPARDPASTAPAAPRDLQVESVHLDTPLVHRRPLSGVAAPPLAPEAAKPGTNPAAKPAPSKPAAPKPATVPPAATAPPEAPPNPLASLAAEITSASEADPEIAWADAAGEGLLSAPPRAARRVPRALEWSEPPVTASDRPLWAKPWVWGSAVVVLFLAGWLLGTDRSSDSPSGLSRALRAIGIGGARFDVRVTSEPPGAWISVDGKDAARRTPATIDLTPGTHQVGLSLADQGGATYEVRGVRGERVALDVKLTGSLAVYAGDGSIPVAVSVDGVSRGLAPVTVDSLAPGTHEVRFSGPGLQPWGQTVQVKVNETAQLTARAVTSPATGVLEVRARWTDAEGSDELTGATVYIDGERRGGTPLSLELPRGPHSVRVESRGEKSPVQVIDLPGGNQRFANFELGLGIDQPTLTVLGTPIKVALDHPAVISAALQGLHASEAREMWLNVRQPDGAWRRYPMTMMAAPGGLVGTSVFPNTLLDSKGRTLFYVSASNQTGDDYFSELLSATELVAAPRN